MYVLFPPIHPEKLFVCLDHSFRITVLLNDKMSNEFWCIWRNLKTQNSRVALHLSCSGEWSINASVPAPLAAQVITEPAPEFDRRDAALGHELFFYFHHFDRCWFLFQQFIKLCSRTPQISFCKFLWTVTWFFCVRCTRGLHLMVNPHEVMAMIADKKTCTPTSQRAFLISCAVIKDFSFPMQMTSAPRSTRLFGILVFLCTLFLECIKMLSLAKKLLYL